MVSQLGTHGIAIWLEITRAFANLLGGRQAYALLNTKCGKCPLLQLETREMVMTFYTAKLCSYLLSNPGRPGLL